MHGGDRQMRGPLITGTTSTACATTLEELRQMVLGARAGGPRSFDYCFPAGTEISGSQIREIVYGGSFSYKSSYGRQYGTVWL